VRGEALFSDDFDLSKSNLCSCAVRTDHAEAIRDLQFDELWYRVALVDPRPICHILANERRNDMGLSSATGRNLVSLSLVLLQIFAREESHIGRPPCKISVWLTSVVTRLLSTLQVKVCAYRQDGPAAACRTA
jgi:hypothetical protein